MDRETPFAHSFRRRKATRDRFQKHPGLLPAFFARLLPLPASAPRLTGNFPPEELRKRADRKRSSLRGSRFLDPFSQLSIRPPRWFQNDHWLGSNDSTHNTACCAIGDSATASVIGSPQMTAIVSCYCRLMVSSDTRRRRNGEGKSLLCFLFCFSSRLLFVGLSLSISPT